jgi:hypothetical protein
MGWNAAACTVSKDFWGPGEHDLTRVADPHPAREAFAQASKRLKNKGYAVDCTLDIGLLCVRATGTALFDAIGQPMMHSGMKMPDEVRLMLETADWTRDSENYNQSEKECAKAFLEICVKHDLAIDLG